MGTQTFDAAIADLVISSGGTTSRTVDGKYEYSDAVSIMLQAPSVLAESVGIEVSFDGTTFVTLQDASGDLSAPAAGKGRQYTEMLGSKKFRLKAGSAVAADRTFKATKMWSA